MANRTAAQKRVRRGVQIDEKKLLSIPGGTFTAKNSLTSVAGTAQLDIVRFREDKSDRGCLLECKIV